MEVQLHQSHHARNLLPQVLDIYEFSNHLDSDQYHGAHHQHIQQNLLQANLVLIELVLRNRAAQDGQLWFRHQPAFQALEQLFYPESPLLILQDHLILVLNHVLDAPLVLNDHIET